MVSDETKWTTIRVSQQTKDGLDSVKHPGQSYDGLIQELTNFWKRGHAVEERVPSQMKQTTVFLSNRIFREGVHFFLASEADIEVIGETTSNEEALSFIETNLPQIAILNIDREVSGLEIARRIKQSVPSVSVILVMDSEDEELLFSAIKGGASACLTKDINPEDMVSIVREVAQGGKPIGQELLRPGLAIRVLDEFEASSLISQQVGALLARLTPGEAEVLRLTGEGSSREQVAANLRISEEAVNRHLDLILSKLAANARDRQLIEATKRGLVAEYITMEEITEPKESLKENSSPHSAS